MPYFPELQVQWTIESLRNNLANSVIPNDFWLKLQTDLTTECECKSRGPVFLCLSPEAIKERAEKVVDNWHKDH